MGRVITETRLGSLNILESYKPASNPNSPVLGSFTVDGIIVENTISQNGTYYESKVWTQPTTFGKGGKFFDENGKLKPSTLLGSLDHPANGQPEMRFENSAIAWRDIKKNGNKWQGTADILNTPAGRIVKTHLDYAKLVGGGEVFGVSLRGFGETESVSNVAESYERIIPESFELMSIDFVYDPSFRNTAMLAESTKRSKFNRLLLAESIKRLAKQDKAHANVYKEYANIIKGGSMKKEVIKEATGALTMIDYLKQGLKALKDDAHKLYNLAYSIESMGQEAFAEKYKEKDYAKTLKELRYAEKKLREQIAYWENVLVNAPKSVKLAAVTEAKKSEEDDLEEVLAAIEADLGDIPEEEEAPADENPEETPEPEEDKEEDKEDKEEGEEDNAEELSEEELLKQIADKLEVLQASIDELKSLVQPVEPFSAETDLSEEDDLEDDLDADLEDEELEIELEPEEDEDLDLDQLSEEELEELSDEELEYLKKHAR